MHIAHFSNPLFVAFDKISVMFVSVNLCNYKNQLLRGKIIIERGAFDWNNGRSEFSNTEHISECTLFLLYFMLSNKFSYSPIHCTSEIFIFGILGERSFTSGTLPYSSSSKSSGEYPIIDVAL